MEIRIWGARGSYPASGARFSEFGHHTPCVSVAAGDQFVILDAGSGAAALGESLRENPVRHIHLLLSHFHHDHVMGLPFLFHGAGDRATISVHTALGSDLALKPLIETLFSAPYFPGDTDGLLERVSFHAHPVGARFTLGDPRASGDIRVETAPLDHPGGSTAFRLMQGKTSVVYVSDVEDSPMPSPALAALAAGADLMIHDTMFTREDAIARRGWGHATFEAAVALSRAAGVKRLAGFHHSPLHDDSLLKKREMELSALLPGAFLAREGQTIAL
jgi:phosphoribosyl 1,2-cyclic phosphodiesterase